MDSLKEVIKMATPIAPGQPEHRLASNVIDNLILNFHAVGGSLLFGFKDVEVNGQPVEDDVFRGFLLDYANASGIDLTPQAIELSVRYLHKLSPGQHYKGWKDLSNAIIQKRERADRRAADKLKREKIFDNHIQQTLKITKS